MVLEEVRPHMPHLAISSAAQLDLGARFSIHEGTEETELAITVMRSKLHTLRGVINDK